MFTDYCVLDFETSGLNPQTDYAIEAAMIRVRNNQITATDAFFIRPHKGFIVSNQTTRLTGITQENIDAGISPDDAYFRLREFIGQDCIVCHNTPFDMGFLMSLARRASDPIRVPTLCTLSLSRKVFPLLANHKLASLAKEFGLSSPVHRAQADCHTTHELLQLIGTQLDKRPSRKFYEYSFVPKRFIEQTPHAAAPTTPPAASHLHAKPDGAADQNSAPNAYSYGYQIGKKTPNKRAVKLFFRFLPILSAAIAAAATGGSISIGSIIAIIIGGYVTIWLLDRLT